MTKESKESLIELLKAINLDQAFTIECLAREYLSNQGLPWQGIHEVELQVEIEQYLLGQGLINEQGVTKLYNIDNKVNKL